MIIKNTDKAGKTVATSLGMVCFDIGGYADVDEEIGNLIVSLRGYEVADNKEIPSKNLDFEKMTLNDLKDHCKNNNIELNAGAKKAEILKILGVGGFETNEQGNQPELFVQDINI